MIDILKIYNVSRETECDLKQFQNLVTEWNKRLNLISKSSVEHIWNRHILDSLQVCKYITKNDKILFDLGSGAGFPGIVIAIVAKEKFPNLKVFLIESITKKAVFLNEAVGKLGLNAEVINDRIENLVDKKADIITSRALAALPKLLEYATPLCTKKTKIIALKGKSWNEEVLKAEKIWSFKLNTETSLTDDNGKILYLENVRRR